MRATNAAYAALTLALTGSLTAGLAGPAAATPHAPTAAGSRAHASAQHDADHVHVLRLRALGGLGRLSGLANSTVQVQNNTREMTPEQRRQLDSQLRDVREYVAGFRTARTLPATGEGRQRDERKAVLTTRAAHGFQSSLERLSGHRAGSAKDREAASKALLDRLEALNTAALKDLGIVSEKDARDGSAPKSAVTRTLIDRQALTPVRLERYDDLSDEVGDLLEDVQESPDGRLSQKDADEHHQDIREELSELRDRSGDREYAALEALELRAEALLDSTREGDTRRSRAEARRLARETVRLLATAPGGRAGAYGDAERGRPDGSDEPSGVDGVRQWTGRLLSSLLD